MKMPRFILRIGFQEFAVPTQEGAATLMRLLADAIPIRADLTASPAELTLEWHDDPHMLSHATMVSTKRIPPGTVFKRKTKAGDVEILRPVTVKDKAPAPKTQAPALRGRAPLQLEFGA